ncbi:MAG: hypothetical protein MI922_06600, partial [Bacteroidales bacterium]|nr:hypothetical protein [Bacteroidales bacterium]
MNTVYVTRLAKFLPNNPVSNDEMEDYLGRIKGKRSKTKNIILRNNKIKQRYYVLDKEGNQSHTNTTLTAEAIKKLEGNGFTLSDIELLTCGTTSPDQLLPSHACMVQGELGIPAIDVVSPTGGCNSSMWALKYAWMSVLAGLTSNAVCTGSEVLSTGMQSKNFEDELTHLEKLEDNPYVAFEREFLRWMLSDGAGAMLLQDNPSVDGMSLRIDWLEIKSFANEVEACMYAGAIKKDDGDLIPWRSLKPADWLQNSVFALQQEPRLLEKYIVELSVEFLSQLKVKYNFSYSDFDYYLPHISSFFFKQKILDCFNKN